MKPKLLTATNHDAMINLGCDCGVYSTTKCSPIVENYEYEVFTQQVDKFLLHTLFWTQKNEYGGHHRDYDDHPN